MPAFPDPDDRLVLEPGCERCPDLVDSRERISWGVGGRNADLVVVGEAPATGAPDADRWRGGNHTGMAYTSRHSGRQVRALFAELGYDPSELYFTNAVKCCPTDDDGNSREPTAEERDTCRSHLLSELEVIDPEWVVPTGAHATATLLATEGRRLDGFLDTVLEPLSIEDLPPVLPILHPSYQNVWLARLGHTRASYLDEIATVLDDDR